MDIETRRFTPLEQRSLADIEDEIATTDNEETLLGMARACTASHLERLVRKHRRADVVEESGRALEQQRARSAMTYFDRDGMLVVRARLTPEEGALVMKALEVSTDALGSKDGSAELSPGQAIAPIELEPAPALAVVMEDAANELEQRWLPPEVVINRDSGYPEWDGEPIDYDWALICLEPPAA